MSSFRSTLNLITIAALLTSTLQPAIVFGLSEMKGNTQPIALESLPAFPEDAKRAAAAVNWNATDWSKEVVLPRDEEEYRAAVQKLITQQKFTEISLLKKKTHRMGDPEALDYYNVPSEIREELRKNSLLPARAAEPVHSPPVISVGNPTDSSKIPLLDIDAVKKEVSVQANNAVDLSSPIGSVSLQTHSVAPVTRVLSRISAEALSEISGPAQFFPKKSERPVSRKESILRNLIKKIFGVFQLDSVSAGSVLIEEYVGIERDVVDSILLYLSKHQNSDGSFGTHQRYELSTELFFTLSNMGVRSSDQYDLLKNYVLTGEPETLRGIAMKVNVLYAFEEKYDQYLSSLVQNQNPDGGYGLYPGYASEVETTMEAAWALWRTQTDIQSRFYPALYYVLGKVGADGSMRYTPDGPASYYLITKTYEYLRPFSGRSVTDSTGQNPLSVDGVLAKLLGYVNAAVDSSGLLKNSSDDTDALLTLTTLQIAEIEDGKQQALLREMRSRQRNDGSFGESVHALIPALNAFAQSDLSIEEVSFTGALVNRVDPKIVVRVKNIGTRSAKPTQLRLFIDGFYIKNFSPDLSVMPVLQPGEAVNFRIGNLEMMSATFVGDMKFLFYVVGEKGETEKRADNNWKEARGTFAPDPNGLSATPLYYIAFNQVFYADRPALAFLVQTHVRKDPNRAGLFVLWRKLGAERWWAAPLPNDEGDIARFAISDEVEDFAEGQTLEVTVGTLPKGMSESKDIRSIIKTTQLTLSLDMKANIGTAQGTLANGSEQQTNTLIRGWGDPEQNGARTDADGAFSIPAISNGSNALFVDDAAPYLEPLRSAVFWLKKGETVSDVEVFTRIKPDTTPPKLREVYLGYYRGKDKTDFVPLEKTAVKNRETAYIYASGEDDIFFDHVEFSYWDPQEKNWNFLASQHADTRSTSTYAWDIPASLSGKDFRVRAVAYDYVGNASSPLEWNPFEIYDSSLQIRFVDIRGIKQPLLPGNRIKNQNEYYVVSESSQVTPPSRVEFSYWDPRGQSWNYLGEASVEFSNNADMKWMIPANILGTGYKFRAIGWDKRGIESQRVESVEYEIIDGTIVPPPVEPPQLRSIQLNWASRGVYLKTMNEYTLFAFGLKLDNVAFSYWDPNRELWVPIPSDGFVDDGNNIYYVWKVPYGLKGKGYKIRAVSNDPGANPAGPVETGAYEIVDGTPPKGSIEVVDVANGWPLGEKKKITLNVEGPNDLWNQEGRMDAVWPDGRSVRISSSVDFSKKEIEYTMPADAHLEGEGAKIKLLACDAYYTCSTITSPEFETLDTSPLPQKPWGREKRQSLFNQTSNLSRFPRAVFPNNPGSITILYEEMEKVRDVSGQEHDVRRLIVRTFESGAWKAPTLVRELDTLLAGELSFDSIKAQRDGSGAIHIAYQESHSWGALALNKYEVYYARVSNGSLQESMNVSNNGSVSERPDIAVSDSGDVSLIWIDGVTFLDESWARSGSAQAVSRERVGGQWSGSTQHSEEHAAQVAVTFASQHPAVVYIENNMAVVRMKDDIGWSSRRPIMRRTFPQDAIDAFKISEADIEKLIRAGLLTADHEKKELTWSASLRTAQDVHRALFDPELGLENTQAVKNLWLEYQYGRNVSELSLFENPKTRMLDLFYLGDNPLIHGRYTSFLLQTGASNALFPLVFRPQLYPRAFPLVDIGKTYTVRAHSVLQNSDGTYHLFMTRMEPTKMGYINRGFHMLIDDGEAFFTSRTSSLLRNISEARLVPYNASGILGVYMPVYTGYFLNTADYRGPLGYRLSLGAPTRGSGDHLATTRADWKLAQRNFVDYTVLLGTGEFELKQYKYIKRREAALLQELLPETTYFWQVVAHVGDVEVYSAPSYFTTGKAAPDIEVSRNSEPVAMGQKFDLGPVQIGESAEITFDVLNAGNGDLVFSPAPSVTFAEGTSDEFTVANDLSGTLAPQGRTNVTLKFTPSSAGVKETTVAISTNDSDERLFQLVLNATGTLPPLATVAAELDLQVVKSPSLGVLLSWQTKTEGAEKLNLERKVGNGEFASIQALAPNTLSARDDTVTFDTTYTYRLRATNAAGVSTFSQEKSLSTPPAVPTAPKEISAAVDAQDGTKVTVSWNIPAQNATQLFLERRSGSDDWREILSVPENSSSVTDVGLNYNIRYFYRLVALNRIGERAVSDEIGVQTPLPPLPLPAAPTNLSASARAELDAEVSLVWIDEATNETSYEVERKDQGGQFEKIANLEKNVSTYVDISVKEKDLATYRVRAINSSGPSPYSNEIGIIVPASLALPGIPARLSARFLAPNAVVLSWLYESSVSALLHVQRKTQGEAGFTERAQLASDVSLFTDRPVEVATAYLYRLMAKNKRGSVVTDEIAISIPDTPPPIPSAPSSLSATSDSHERVILTWKDTSDVETDFVLERSLKDTFEKTDPDFTSTTLAANVQTFKDLTVQANTTYWYRVRAVNGSGDAVTESVQVQTLPLPPPPPPAPANLSTRVEGVSDFIVKLSWADNADNETLFEVERRGPGSAESSDFIRVGTVSANGIEWTDDRVSEKSEYTYRVRAINKTGPGPYSSEVVITTPRKPLPPGDVLGLKGAFVSPAAVILSWTYSPVEEDDAIEVQRKKDGEEAFTALEKMPASISLYTDIAVDLAAHYVYRLRVVNKQGEAFSELLPLTTPAPDPLPPPAPMLPLPLPPPVEVPAVQPEPLPPPLPVEPAPLPPPVAPPLPLPPAPVEPLPPPPVEVPAVQPDPLPPPPPVVLPLPPILAPSLPLPLPPPVPVEVPIIQPDPIAGSGTGLRGDYYDDINLSRLVYSTNDALIDFNWGLDAPPKAKAVLESDTFSIRWSGFIQAPYTGDYTFTTRADDGVRLFVNGAKIIEDWRAHKSTENTSQSITLTAGEKVPIILEYYDSEWSASVSLSWTNSVTKKRELIPSTYLYSDPLPDPNVRVSGSGNGLRGDYYNDLNFRKLLRSRTDSEVAFNWGLDAPLEPLGDDGFSVEWTGYVQAPRTALYTFTTRADDGVKLSVDGVQRIDDWNTHRPTIIHSAPFQLIAGEKYPITLRYFDKEWGASVKLMWSDTVTGVREVIPAEYLYSDALPDSQNVAKGSGHGLMAEYYQSIDFTGTATTTRDAVLDFDWGWESPHIGIEPETYSIRWSGYVFAPLTAHYQFISTNDDGARISINNRSVINDWSAHGYEENFSDTQLLERGKLYPITVEYYNGEWDGVFRLEWRNSLTGTREIIPREYFYEAEALADFLPLSDSVKGTGTGLLGRYYRNSRLTDLAFERVDSQVRFDWDLDSPALGMLGEDEFSVEWNGFVQAPVTGSLAFVTESDDGIRLEVDGKTLLDDWSVHDAVPIRTKHIAVQRGEKYAVRLRYFEDFGKAEIRLYWIHPITSMRELIPQEYLYTQ